MAVAISMQSLRRVRAADPPRVAVHGPPGMGKTTLAAEFPAPVFLQIEDGAPADLEIDTFGRLETYEDVMNAIGSLYEGEHAFETVVVDSLDKLEPLVWAAVCAEMNWKSIEAPGYGKGYVEADRFWRDFLDGLNALRRDKRMSVVMIAHSSIETVNDPMTAPYSRYDMRLHKRANALVQDEVDAILFLNQDVSIKADDVGFNKKQNRAEGGGRRWVYAAPRPAFVAKNRYGIPDKFLFERGKGFAALAPHFPHLDTAAAEAA